MRLKINNTVLNVFEAGVGNYRKTHPTLIFLHYFGGSSRAWTKVVAELAADYHCVAPDLRGFGASDAPAENYAVNDYADDAADLIRALEIKNYVLIGHSMGGKIALALAARNPKGLQSLILLAPSPPTPEPVLEETRAELLASHGNRRVAAEMVSIAVNAELSDEVFERTVNDNLRTSEAAWKSWLIGGSREDVSSEVERINVPVFVVAGEKDEAMTPKLLEREVVRRIEGAHLVVVPEVKHLLPLEVPSIVASLIREHCESFQDSVEKSFDKDKRTKNKFDGAAEKRTITEETVALVKKLSPVTDW